MDAAARRAAVRSALLGAAVLLTAAASSASEIVVTNVSDVVNGDVSSPAALLANPGPDGISLREAIEAANTTRGFHTIMISAALAGQTIALTGTLPFVTRDGVTLSGLTDPTGQPSITIAAAPDRDALVVYASEFTLTGFRFTDVTRGSAVFIRAGAAPDHFPAPQRIENIWIEGNLFVGTGEPQASAVTIAPENGSVDAVISNVTITDNMFLNHGDADGTGVGTAGRNGLVENVIIEGNTFSDNDFPVEIDATGSNGRVTGVRITGNTFTNNFQPITITGGASGITLPPQTGNVIEGVLIEGNVILGHGNPAANIVAGFNASGNAILNTQIVNNVITGGTTLSLGLVGGSGGSATGNRVDGVRIANNTIMGEGFHVGVTIHANDAGATGNTVAGVTIVNTIFVSGGEDFAGDTSPDLVSHSITSKPGFAGVNGNISADPKFVDPAQGDFHLQPGSPAIDAGTSDDAPQRDLEGRPRFDDPARPNTGSGQIRYYDMGAYEFSTLSTYRLTVKAAPGVGGGTITSDPSGLDCGAECSALFYAGTLVALTAVPATGSVFAGWSGDPACANGAITITADTTCTARFSRSRHTIVVPFRP